MSETQTKTKEKQDKSTSDKRNKMLNNNTDNTPFVHTPRKVNHFKAGKKTLITILSVIFVLTLLASMVIWAYFRCQYSVIAEVGSPPDYSHMEKNIILSVFSKIDCDINEIDCSKARATTVPIRFLGFIKLESKLEFKDTTPPSVSPRNVFISVGVSPTAEMFTKSVSDCTKAAVAMVSGNYNTDVAGTYSISLRAKDEYYNSTDFNCNLTVIDTTKTLFFENGKTIEDVKVKLRTLYPDIKNFDFSQAKEHGDFLVEGELSGDLYVLKISIDDITPPTATVKSFDVLLGNTIYDSDIVFNIVDQSDVSIAFSNRADFNKAGEYLTKITLTDTYGNVTEYESCIRVHNINTNITAELGCSLVSLSDLLFNDNFSRSRLKIATKLTELGHNSVSLVGKYNTLTVNANMIDTTPPALNAQNVSKLLGSTVSHNDFIISCTDALPVSYTLSGEYSTETEGTYPLTLTATDSNGNSTTTNVDLTIFVDRIPPEIYGVKDLRYIIGEDTPDYLLDITATDEVWGKIEVSVDTSTVNLQDPGTYTITYSATDQSGNTATQTSSILVKYPTRVKLRVSNIMQRPVLPNGCEVVSLAIALKYAGYTIDPLELYENYMPRTPLKEGDPWTTYVGDATGIGYGCYAPCVVTTGNDYLSAMESDKKVYDVSGKDLSEYEKYIDSNTPVIFWGLIEMNGDEKLAWGGYINGKYVNWHSYSHCLVLIGYTDYNFIFCDPLRGVVEYDKESVEKSFDINYRQACIIQ